MFYLKEVRKRAAELKPINQPVEALLQTQSLATNQELSQRRSDPANDPQLRLGTADEAKRKARCKVQNMYTNLHEDITLLNCEITKPGNWSLLDDHTIRQLVRELDSWKKNFDKIQEKVREMKELTDLNNLDDVPFSTIQAMFATLRKDLSKAIEMIQEQDGPQGRCLFTNDSNKPAMVKLPKFSGKSEEDFSRFKKEMTKGLLQNRVAKADQVAKLRESLSGFAKQLVPETMTDIMEAWLVLQAAFGDPARVMKARKEAVANLGPFPSGGRGTGPIKRQVEWLMNLEINLRDIVELGDTSNDMNREAYSGATLAQILHMFPLTIQADLATCVGDGRDRMLQIIEEIKNIREIRQELLKTAEIVEPPATNLRPAGGGHQQGGGNDTNQGAGKSSERFGNRGKNVNVSNAALAMITFSPPRRDEKCRICTVLDTKGDTKNLYENHRSNFPTGCPRFANMATHRRREIAREAKLCPKCLDPDFIVSNKTDGSPVHPECKITKDDKSFFTCRSKVKTCKTHMWICNLHKKENQFQLNKIAEQWKSSGVGTFIFNTNLLKTPDIGIEDPTETVSEESDYPDDNPDETVDTVAETVGSIAKVGPAVSQLVAAPEDSEQLDVDNDAAELCPTLDLHVNPRDQP